MFPFPQPDCGIIILDFEKIAFFYSEAIFGHITAPEKSFFTWRTLLKIPLLFEKKRKHEKFFWNFLENVLSYSEIYFESPRTSRKKTPPLYPKKCKKDRLSQDLTGASLFEDFQLFCKIFWFYDAKTKMWLGGTLEHKFPRLWRDSWASPMILRTTFNPTKIHWVCHFSF